MPIVAADLLFRLSASMPKNDTDGSGGAIDTSGKMSNLVLASPNTLEIVSSNAGDTTQNVTVEGRDAAGSIITDTQTLNGTTPVAITGTFKDVLRVSMSATAAGTVTLRISSAGATVVTLEAGLDVAHRFFYDAASAGTQRNRYEKGFLVNNHGTLTLTNARVVLTADTTSNVKIGLETSKDGSGSVGNRLSAPTVVGGAFSDDSVEITVPTGELAAGERIGIWVEQELAADEGATLGTFTIEGRGTTAA